MTIIKKIIYYFLIIGVAAVGLLLLGTLTPIAGNYKVKIVKSGSMEPTIMTGGMILIHPASVYKVGDIITFGQDTKVQVPTTHRIVAEQNGAFQTKGDANDAADPTFTQAKEVEGKVIFSLPYVGYILDFARKPLGFFLLVGIPALSIILDELLKIWQEIKRIRREKREGKKDEMSSKILDLRIRPKQIEKETSWKTINAALIILLSSLIGFSRVGGTVSYFNESEASIGNFIGASDFPSRVVATSTGSVGAFSVEESTSTPEIIVEATTTPESTSTPEVVESPPQPPPEATAGEADTSTTTPTE